MDSKRPDRLQLPASLEAQLREFRGRVWVVKSIEAVGGAAFGVGVAYLAVFALDRLIDTPVWARLALFALAIGGGVRAALALHTWIWRQRRWDQLARLLSRRYPSVGDQLLGIIELAHNEFEQARSRALCEAAIGQVAESAAKRDFRDAVPRPRHRLWAGLAAAPAALACVVLAIWPDAAANAWARFVAPWGSTPRYTFTALEALPQRIVVPHGEPLAISLRLEEDSPWRPATGVGRLGAQTPVEASLAGEQYEFAFPPQLEGAPLEVKIGDALASAFVEPMLRPELSAVGAEATLPAYLGRGATRKDIRGGGLTLVKGSTVTLAITANRPLSTAEIDGQPRSPQGSRVVGEPLLVDAARKVVFSWRDEHGLAGKQPFTVTINPRDDEPPSIVCEDLPRQRVVLDSELLKFKIRASDDFGVRVVGLEWKGTDPALVAKPAQGERLLGAGGCDKELLELAGSFSAASLGIEPQPIEARLFVEDYFPGRGRMYSPTYQLYVLSAEQHFVWLTEQLERWRRQSLEVRDREMQLHQTNQQMRLLDPEELNQPATRRRVEAQSAAERANGRRLSALVAGGEELARQALKNPEFGPGHLEKWAEMLRILQDISANRMPNVADLLKQSSQAPVAMAAGAKSAPAAGRVQDARPGAGGAKQSAPKQNPPPKFVDRESSQQPANRDVQAEDPNKKAGGSKSGLPVTTVVDPHAKPAPPGPAGQKLDQAVGAQQDLLAEFEKVADELNKVLGNLEGSTLVKRLKAASREQSLAANKINDQVGALFGRPVRDVVRDAPAANAEPRKLVSDVSSQELKSSQTLSTIMDDIQSYFERRRFQRFKTVLDEMRELDVVGALKRLSDDLPKEAGMSMAQCEYWSDTFDRWADDLVDPACSGKCPGSKSNSSLPPSIVLEALRILEGEVNLREETRGAEQARAALRPEAHAEQAAALGKTQSGLGVRVGKLAERIRGLPDGEREFAFEIKLLGVVEQVMEEAAGMLGRAQTGSPTIAAETEAIELLLRSKKINPYGRGGGGASPGGGGGGTTDHAALALLGAGLNEKELREDHDIAQSTGPAGPALPEEFRAGLDEYFNRLDEARPK